MARRGPMARALALAAVGVAGTLGPLHTDLAGQAPETEFNPPPAVVLSAAELGRLRERVRLDAATRQAFEFVRATADSALRMAPDPPGAIVYEGRVGHDPERLATIRRLHDLRRLRALGWAYAVTGRSDYRDAGRAYLLAWMRRVEPTGNPINDSRLVDLLRAYPLLAPALDSRDRAEAEGWISRLARRETASDTAHNVGNWHARRLTLVALAGLLLGDPRLTDYVLREARRYVESSFRPDGTSWDLERRDALHYHVSGITPVLEIALLLRARGVDLYRHQASTGASVQRSVEYVLPFARGERVHPEWVNSKVALDRRRWESGDPFYRPGKPWDPQESREMLELASVFDPALGEVAARLGRGAPAGPDWDRIVLDVAQAAR